MDFVASDGAALRYRQDVRREMIPLIRDERPHRFQYLHRIAWDYFATRAQRDGDDLVAAAEAIYHGLWLGRPLHELHAYWRGGSFQPRIDPEEFEQDSDAVIFLQAKSGALLPPAKLRRLEPTLRLDWLDRRKQELAEETRINESVASVRVAAGEEFELVRARPDLTSAPRWRSLAPRSSRRTIATGSLRPCRRSSAWRKKSPTCSRGPRRWWNARRTCLAAGDGGMLLELARALVALNSPRHTTAAEPETAGEIAHALLEWNHKVTRRIEGNDPPIETKQRQQ